MQLVQITNLFHFAEIVGLIKLKGSVWHLNDYFEKGVNTKHYVIILHNFLIRKPNCQMIQLEVN